MFSQVIDVIVKRTNRVDMLDTIIEIANSVIRRIQAKQFFLSDLKSLTITEDTLGLVVKDGRWIWERSPDCRLINSVFYKPSMTYPPNDQPSAGHEHIRNCWSKVGNKYLFKSDAPLKEIEITYFGVSKEFLYQSETTRTIQYNWNDYKWYEKNIDTNEWVALTDEEVLLREDELSNFGNWLLRDWKELIITGTIAKLWATINDSERFRYEFAEFNNMFETLTSNERFANYAY